MFLKKKGEKNHIYILKKEKIIIYTNYKNWIFLHRFVKEIFFQEIWALGKIIYFIYCKESKLLVKF